MSLSALSTDHLRELAGLRLEHGAVLSLYLDLDPTEFAHPQARASAVRSLLDEADRVVRGRDDLDHEEAGWLREDLERARTHLESALDATGALGLAIFSSTPAGLWEVIKLPRRVASAVVVDGAPFVEPLAALPAAGDWCVALVNRREARILRGPGERVEPILVVDDDVPGQHDQGGWSQARLARSVAKDVHDHLLHVAAELLDLHKAQPIGCLAIAAPEDAFHELCEVLHPWLRERFVGRVEVAVADSTPEQVREAVAPLIERHDSESERTLLDRLAAGIGADAGHGAHGIADVLRALTEQRVEALLFDHGFTAPGYACDAAAWIGARAEDCPLGAEAAEAVPDITERAVESALAQAASVRAVRHHQDLGPLGGIGAVLRF